MMASSSRPLRIAEVLDIVERRARLLRAVVAGVVLLGVATTVLAPGLLPRTPLAGALVALAAIIVGVASAVVADAGDGTIRGPRHVRSVGGELVGVLPTQASPAAAQELAGAVLEARGARRVVLGLTGSGRGVDVPAWSEALATAIAERGASVLLVDVASGATPHDGLLEVVVHGASLGHSVTFERDIKLARLGAGRDLDGAIRAASELPARLPRDLEVLLVALPPVAAGDVLAAAASLDAVLVLARSDATPRVRLGAAIEALEGAGTVAQVVLIDDRSARTSAGQERAEDPAPESRTPESRTPESAAPETTQPEPEPEPEPEVEAVATPTDAPTDAPTDTPTDAPRPSTPVPGPVAPDAVAATEPAEDAAEPGPAPDPGSDPRAEQEAPAAPEADARGPAQREPDPPSAAEVGPPGSTSRREIERPPSPSVRLLRDLPPTPPTPPTPAATAAPEASPTSSERPPSEEPQRPAAATPRDPAVDAAAAAARLAAQLNAPGAPPSSVGDEHDGGAEQPTADPPGAEQPVADPSVADPPVEDPPVADPPVEDPPVEDPPVEEPPVDDEVVDPTDELPAIRDERLAAPQAEDDPLRTTAQLALLMDELGEREGDADRG